MGAPRRHHEERLADRIPARGIALNEELADVLGGGRAARLARRQRVDPRARERGDEPRDLRRLAGALAALDSNEAAAAQCFRPSSR
jgi:hypothetical protein